MRQPANSVLRTFPCDPTMVKTSRTIIAPHVRIGPGPIHVWFLTYFSSAMSDIDLTPGNIEKFP